MRGHIKKRGINSWSVIVERPRDPTTGKRRQQWHTVHGTKRDAERFLRDIQLALDKGTYVKPNRIKLGEWLNQWLECDVIVNTTPRTYESYREAINKHIIPGLGNIALSELEPLHVQGYYGMKLKKGRIDGQGGLSAKSVLYQHHILSKAIDYAVKMGFVARNVISLIAPPRVQRVTMNTLNTEEVLTFLDAAKESPYYVFFSTLLFTGLRRGEALALRWRNLDLSNACLRVVESAHTLRNGEYVVKEPKTPHSRRMVTLPPSLVALFKEYRADQELLRIHLGTTLSNDDFVFIGYKGKPLNPDVVTHAFGKVVGKAGFRNIRLHDLRHTHATLMLKAGVHPKIVSERLGHASIRITLDIYSHVLPGLQEAAAEKFDKIFDEDVSKMLATDRMVERGAEGIRTPYLLTARYRRLVPESKTK